MTSPLWALLYSIQSIMRLWNTGAQLLSSGALLGGRFLSCNCGWRRHWKRNAELFRDEKAGLLLSGNGIQAQINLQYFCCTPKLTPHLAKHCFSKMERSQRSIYSFLVMYSNFASPSNLISIRQFYWTCFISNTSSSAGSSIVEAGVVDRISVKTHLPFVFFTMTMIFPHL